MRHLWGIPPWLGLDALLLIRLVPVLSLRVSDGSVLCTSTETDEVVQKFMHLLVDVVFVACCPGGCVWVSF